MSISGLAQLKSQIGSVGTSNDSQSSTKTEKKIKTRSMPTCSLCRNHGISVLYRGHKRKCRFAMCVCQKCTMTKERRRVMSWHVNEHRANYMAHSRLGEAMAPSTCCANPTSFNHMHPAVYDAWPPTPPGFQALVPYSPECPQPQIGLGLPVPTYYQHYRPTGFLPYDESYPTPSPSPGNNNSAIATFGAEKSSQLLSLSNYYYPTEHTAEGWRPIGVGNGCPTIHVQGQQHNENQLQK
ncbi:doublesex- and mab-3-related transcription factor C2-like [Anneissia japonica]|uniref:doublesex- and mab-3-related transcription factor C2-like n=1 Tax=Anneissia japonica TaxID=1529436 RepID=UPI00142585D6|nr:doublesex- and mab-3-related transcription factor C2-like [Anneissia japonica]